MFCWAKFALKNHAACDPGARNDTPFDLLAGLSGSFAGPPIFSPVIDRGEQQIGRAPEAHTARENQIQYADYMHFFLQNPAIWCDFMQFRAPDHPPISLPKWCIIGRTHDALG
jgi:hypothetical protein